MDTAAARRIHDDLLASRPDGASHNADICPFCVDKATEDTTASRNPPADGGPDESDHQPTEHGGRDNHPMSDTMTTETHEALLAKAVADATSATEKALETKTAEAKDLAAKLEAAQTEAASLKADNDRLNKDLDTAQVGLTAAQEKVTQLESDIAKQAEETAKAELASKRSEQVKNLKLYPDEYIAERASSWADLSDDDWAGRLEEWGKIRPASTEAPANGTDTAMSGTSGELTKEPEGSSDTADETKKPSARRAVLGLS